MLNIKRTNDKEGDKFIPRSGSSEERERKEARSPYVDEFRRKDCIF